MKEYARKISIPEVQEHLREKGIANRLVKFGEGEGDEEEDMTLEEFAEVFINLLRSSTVKRLGRLVEQMLPYLQEDDFIFRKKYTIKKSVSMVYGKWPQTYGNTFFTDSKYLLQDLLDMAEVKAIQILERNDQHEQVEKVQEEAQKIRE